MTGEFDAEKLAGTDADGEGVLSWRALLAEAEQRFRSAADTIGLAPGGAGTEARWVVEEASGFEGAEFDHGLDQLATVRGVARFDRMVRRRLAGEPIQYVLGHWPFRHLDLMVDHRVLIPRPETEVVTEHALAELNRVSRGSEVVLAADLGTGSGAIGLSLAVEHRRAQIWLSDRSPDAIAVARANLAGIGGPATRVNIVEGSWFEPFGPDLLGRFALVVSNPPYVRHGLELDRSVADWEPAEALLAAEDGMAELLHLVETSPRWLRPDGALVLEFSPEQAPVVHERARHHFAEAEVFQDLAGLDRGIVARHPRPVGQSG